MYLNESIPDAAKAMRAIQLADHANLRYEIAQRQLEEQLNERNERESTAYQQMIEGLTELQEGLATMRKEMAVAFQDFVDHYGAELEARLKEL